MTLRELSRIWNHPRISRNSLHHLSILRSILPLPIPLRNTNSLISQGVFIPSPQDLLQDILVLKPPQNPKEYPVEPSLPPPSLAPHFHPLYPSVILPPVSHYRTSRPSTLTPQPWQEVDHRGLKTEIWRHPKTRGGSIAKLMLKAYWHLSTQWKIHLITSGEKNIYTTIWSQGPVKSTIDTHIIGAHHVHTQVKEGGLM